MTPVAELTMTPVYELSGRELDAAVAVKIFGWKGVTEDLYGYPPGTGVETPMQPIPCYHADANLAIAAAEKTSLDWEIAKHRDYYSGAVFSAYCFRKEPSRNDPSEALLRACVAEVRAQREKP